MNHHEQLSGLKFKKIGRYSINKTEVFCDYEVKKTERLSIVYAFVVEDEIKYFGKSIQGYRRPLSYHKNHVMKTVQNGIFDCCHNNQVVDIYARKDDLEIKVDSLNLDIIEALEQALIKKYQPLWNNHIQK